MFFDPPQKIKILNFCYSLLDVSVSDALDESGFDEKMFLKRGGKYEWSKADQKLDW
jgi:radical S-adenosyl methionine domain-containing protein 2